MFETSPFRVLGAVRAAVGRFRRDASGGVVLLFGLMAIPLMLTIGVTIDYYRAAAARARLQQALDDAAIAAANGPNLTKDARQLIAKNVGLANLGGLNAQINAEIRGPFETAGPYKVTATASVPTTFMKLAGFNSVPLSVSASANNDVPGASETSTQTTTTTTTTTTPYAVCVLLLSKPSNSSSTANQSQALLVNSGAKINAPNCEMDVASTGSPAAMINSGIVYYLDYLCVAGNSVTQNGSPTITNGSNSTSVLHTGCTAATNPFQGHLPTVSVGSCTVSNQNYSGTVNLSPGVYCGNFNFNGTGTLNLASGLYVFNNTNWNINSGWSVTGTGVTIYFATSNSYIQFNGTATTSLTAPTTGTYANILFFEPDGFTFSNGGNQITINGSNASPYTLSGLIYLPSRQIVFNSGASGANAQITLVADTLIQDSSTTWNITPMSSSCQIGTSSTLGCTVGSASNVTTSTTTSTATQTVTTTLPSSVRLTR
jgi:Flp pilus assembly protein TadG